jgi:hypothetical protein
MSLGEQTREGDHDPQSFEALLRRAQQQQSGARTRFEHPAARAPQAAGGNLQPAADVITGS